MIRCRAAVLQAPGEPLSIETVEVEPPRRGEVLVRLTASGLCHTDLEVIEGRLAYPMPIVLGHEGAGVVEAVGPDVSLLRPGQHVVCSWNPSCGHCFYCDRDQPILCESFTRHQPAGHLLDGTSRLSIGGAKVHHFSVVSSHAEVCVVPETGAVPVPADLPGELACLIGCGVMTGYGAVVNVARVEPGSTVAVFGCGAVGLNAVQAAALVRAGAVVAVDSRADRLALARRLGASHGVVAGPEAAAAVRALTDGRGADSVIEAAGSPVAFRSAVEACRPGGTVVFLGKVEVDREVTFRWGSLMGERRIVRSSYGGARPRRDFPRIARACLEGRLDLASLVTNRLTLGQINEGFARMARGATIREVVLFP